MTEMTRLCELNTRESLRCFPFFLRRQKTMTTIATMTRTTPTATLTAIGTTMDIISLGDGDGLVSPCVSTIMTHWQ